MTHSINFKATDELLALFTAQQAEGVESPLASIKVAIADETFVLAGTTPSAGDEATDFAPMKATLEADCACYVLFRRRVATEPWALLSFVPDTAPIKEKMLLSSSKEALKKALGGVFGLEVQFSALEDVALEGEKSDAEKAAEQLAMMTTFEREAAEVKRGEAGAAADGKVKSSNLAFPLSADASAQLDAFAAGTVAMVALSIEGETIALRRAEADLPLASLAAALPTDEPSYGVFRWAHERDGAAVAPVLFVYMCPEDAPVRGKMLHASSKASMVQPASDVQLSGAAAFATTPRSAHTTRPPQVDGLASLGIAVEKSLEVTEASDLDEAAVTAEVYPAAAEALTAAPKKAAPRGGRRLVKKSA